MGSNRTVWGENMKTLILYFSGTGNTAYGANVIKEALQELGSEVEVHSIDEKFEIMEGTYDRLVLGFPKYYELPTFYFVDYLKHHLPASENTIPTMAFCTQAGPLKTDFKGLEKLLARKNHRLIVEKSFPVANNLLIFSAFRPTEKETLTANLVKLRSDVIPLLNDFIKGIEHKERLNPFLAFTERLVAISCTKLFPVFAMKYSSSPECIGCGLCAKKCPQRNIAMKAGRPEFGKHCMFCMRCINICPKNAILYNKKKCRQYGSICN